MTEHYVANEAPPAAVRPCRRADDVRLRVAERQAHDAVAQRDRFLAMLAHELRNPLSAMVNAAEVLARVGGPQTEPAVAIIRRRSRHMARMLDDLLDVSRITQGKVEIRREPVDLAVVVRKAVEEVRPTFDQRRLELATDLPEGPATVVGDPTRLGQVLANLLNNAAKYTSDGGEVRCSLRREEGAAVVRVRDTGVGMAPELLERAFDLFVQADQPLDRSDGGIGVGLTLVKGLVELHGGRVEARSEGQGMGSEFVVRLPLAAPVAPAPRPSPNGAVGSKQVLLVEDDPDIRESLADLLRLDGHDVRVAEDCPTAMAALEERLPEVALLDIGLPEIDGYRLARRIRERFPTARLRLVALTGYGRPSDREAALAAGFDDHVTKPASSATLGCVLAGKAAPADG